MAPVLLWDLEGEEEEKGEDDGDVGFVDGLAVAAFATIGWC